ncbi:hypothetical protein QS257_05280 [Terrilactibacillus sp. S3-3]|nr:hypothetical protein QS257_05280 [Terrilactibacillus sp. S3-3]
MIGLISAIILFNTIAFLMDKKLSKNEIVHIWTFTISFQLIVDLFIDVKYHGYWYFSKSIDWTSIPALTVLIPPINIIYLNWYPFRASFMKQLFYFAGWLIFIIIYEALALLPEPWGYFHYGWWKLTYSALINPFLLLFLFFYYKWIRKIEKE